MEPMEIAGPAVVAAIRAATAPAASRRDRSHAPTVTPVISPERPYSHDEGNQS
jgi:hypothetical protein